MPFVAGQKLTAAQLNNAFDAKLDAGGVSAFSVGMLALGNSAAWISALGLSVVAGTVTSVGMSVPTGFSIVGSPITTSGVLALSYAAGYVGYTTAESAKLSGIAAGAEVNVNADWTSGSGDSQILNKPTLGTASAQNIASTAEARSFTANKILDAAAPLNAAAAVAISYSATITLDFTNATTGGNNFSIGALTGNVTFANPSSMPVGVSGFIKVPQDSTGGRTYSFGNRWFPITGAAISPPTGANQIGLIFYTIISSTEIAYNIVRGSV